MTTKAKSKSTNKKKEVVNELRQIMADSYALLGQLHICHWNVTGPSFFSLHNAFEEQYTELFPAIDEIAERIRALGHTAPGGLSNLAKMSKIKEIKEDCSADEMVQHLYDSHELLIKNLTKARDTASEANDDQTEDLIIARIQLHDKSAWMLKSYLSSGK